MKIHEKSELSKIILEHAFNKYDKIFVACSFGKDSLVVAHLAMAVKNDVPFIGIDTGFEFPETLSYAEELIKEWNMNFTWARPEQEDVDRINRDYGDSFVKNGQYKCCEMKLPAIARHLPNYNAWVTGLRRDETESRRNTPLVEAGERIRINPIAFWSEADVWEYIKSNQLKYHPLYDSGYKSLGCKPCTTDGSVKSGGGRQGQFERAGR